MSDMVSRDMVSRPVSPASHPAFGVRRGRLATMLLAAGMALSLAGCDRDNSASLALKKAETEIRGLIPGREHVPVDQFRETTYSNVLTTLAPVAQSGTESQKAAAAAMIAQARAGLAEGPAAQAAQLERQTQGAIISLRAAHSQFLTHSAIAEAAAAYDPQPELDEIESQVRKLDQEKQIFEQRKAEIDRRVQELNTQAEGLTAEAQAKRAEAATIKGRIANETATRGEELMKQAYELSRAADALELQSETLKAEAAKIEPDSLQAQLDIDRVIAQQALLAEARQNVQQRSQASRAQAAEARAAANKVAEEIRELVRATDSMRTSELAKAWEEAAQNYQQAASSAAQSASRGSKSAAQMAVGSYQQSLGDVYSTRAQGMQAWATILQTLATSNPPVSAELATLAERANGDAKELLQQATEAYSAANDAYQAAGGNSEAAARIDRVNELLARAVNTTSGGSKDIRVVRSAPEEEGMGDTGEGAAPVDSSSPNATLAALKAMSDSGDYSNFADYFVTQTDQERQMVQAMGTISKGMTRLQKALEEKFGAEGRQMLTSMGQSAGGGGMDFDFDPSSVQFEIDGDTATAQGPNGQPLVMKQVDGQWKMSLGAAELPPGTAEQMANMAPALSRAMESLAADVEAGKYATAQEAGAAMMQKMTEAAMQGMRPGGGG